MSGCQHTWQDADNMWIEHHCMLSTDHEGRHFCGDGVCEDWDWSAEEHQAIEEGTDAVSKWTPKAGEKVTSTVLVGEWLYLRRWNPSSRKCDVRQVDGDEVAAVSIDTLSPVPTPPPEPPRFIHYAGGAYRRTTGNVYGPIPVLIDPADPDQVRDAGLCRVDEVRDWLFRGPASASTLWLAFDERFGGGCDE